MKKLTKVLATEEMVELYNELNKIEPIMVTQGDFEKLPEHMQEYFGEDEETE